MNILLIEDDAGLVELISANLEELGFSVMSANSGTEALALLKKQTPDLMLLDYSLPDKNGKEVIETLKMRHIPLPPFIITTGQGDERIAVDMMKLGAMDYLIKDILFLEKLPDVVKRVIKEIDSEGKLMQTEEALRQSEATIKNKLKAITDPEGDISTLELSEIIDTEVLKSMMEDFYQLTGMLGAVLDVSGKVLVAVGWQDICTKFHRCNPQTLKNCIESDTMLTQGVPEGTFKSYHCKNNMWDIVTPLMVGGRHVGNVFMGQYFLENEVPNIEFFRNQANKYGFDEAAYLAALDRVPRFSEETVDAGMHFYSKLAGIISTMSFSVIQQSRMLAEQKLAEEKTRAAEENLKSTFDVSPSIICKANIDTGYFLDVNQAVTRILGYSFEEFRSKPFIELIHPDDKQRTIDMMAMQMNGKEVTFFENRYLCRDGSYKWLAWNVTKADKNGIVTAIASDVSVRKQAEGSVRKLTTAVKQSPSMIVIADTEGKLEYVNPKFTEVTGYSSSEVIGEESNILNSGEQNALFYTEMWKTVESGKVWRGQFHNKKKNGELFWEAASIAAILNESGDIINFIKIGEDITEFRKAQDEIKQRMTELQIFNDAAVDRELVINDLRQEINELLIKLEQDAKYKVFK